MRTSEERVASLHQRMDELEEKQAQRKFGIQSAVIAAAGLAAAVLLAVLISTLPVVTPPEADNSAAASIFTDNGALGYVVVAILAFVLGALVTVLCFRIRRHEKMKQKEKEEEPKEDKLNG